MLQVDINKAIRLKEYYHNSLLSTEVVLLFK
jgi:hypothetical protein